MTQLSATDRSPLCANVHIRRPLLYRGSFISWYKNKHRHSSLALLTPADVHYGRAEQILEQRAATLRTAFEGNLQRFKGRLRQQN